MLTSNSNLELSCGMTRLDRKDCQNTRKAYKTSRFVGRNVGWKIVRSRDS
jgi:hypothetical protein